MERPHQLRRGWSPALALAAALVPLAVLVVFFLVPLWGMVGRGFFPDGSLDLGGVVDQLVRPRVAGVLWFTLWSASLGTLLTMLLGVPTAYALSCLALPGAGLLRALVTVPFVLPTVVVGVAFRSLLARDGPAGFLGWDGSAAAIVAALVFFNISVVVRIVGPAWASLDPRPAQAAAALGARPATVLRTVTLPSLRPALVSAAVVVFLFCATAFGIVLTLGGVRYATVETEIYLLTTQFLDLQGAAALSVLQLLVVVVLLVLAARTDRRRVAVPRSGSSATRPPRGPGPAAASVVTGLVVAFLLAPLATLVVRSVRSPDGWTLRRYRALADPTGGPAGRAGGSVLDAVETSLRVATDATLLAVTLGALVAVLATRRPRAAWLARAARVFDGLFMLPLGVSAVTIGFGFLVALDTPPFDFRSRTWLLPVAQALVALPLVVRAIAPTLRGIDPRQLDAAASLGAGPLRVLATLELATAWRAVLAAAGFAFAVSLGEFGATSFLSRPDDPTLTVLIYQLLAQPTSESAGTALAAAVLLGSLTTAVVLLVERLRPVRTGAF